jgi:hypothetical protein
MPTLPTATLENFDAAQPGALISVKTNNGQLMHCIRIRVPGEGQGEFPGVAWLQPRQGGGFDARLVHLAQDQRVVNHGNAWLLYVRVKDWDPNPGFVNFAPEHSGLLLLEEGDGPVLGLAVTATGGGCAYLSLATWLLQGPPAGVRYAVARLWNLALPGVGPDVQWPLN